MTEAERQRVLQFGAEVAADWSYAEACDAREVRRLLLEKLGHAALSRLAERYVAEVRDNQPFSKGIASGIELTMTMALGWEMTADSLRLIGRALTISYIGEVRVAAFQEPSQTTEGS